MACFVFSVFPLCGLCKLENHTVVVNLREVFLLLTHRWEIFPGAPCVCWLLFQTISTSLIILISHFYAWVPLFSRSPLIFFLFSILFRLFSTTLCLTHDHTRHSTFIRWQAICILASLWQGKILMRKQNNWTGKFSLRVGNRSDILFQESRDLGPIGIHLCTVRSGGLWNQWWHVLFK